MHSNDQYTTAVLHWISFPQHERFVLENILFKKDYFLIRNWNDYLFNSR